MKKISNLGGNIAQRPVLLAEIKLTIAVKKHTKVDVKLFLPCPVSLYLPILLHIPCPGL